MDVCVHSDVAFTTRADEVYVVLVVYESEMFYTPRFRTDYVFP